jgi:SET domain-containing protein
MITDVVVRPAGRKGNGVFALRAFRKGEFIFRRRHGRTISNADIRSLSREDRRHLCELDFKSSAVLLPPGSYLNHSCDPNAMRSGVKVFAWRDIRPGEEITIDYRLNAFGGRRSKCLCGSVPCGGVIVADFFSLESALQRRYLPYAPAFIQREYRRRSASPPGPGVRPRRAASSPD